MPSLPTTVTSNLSAPERTGETVYSWTVHLARREPQKLPRILILLLGIFVLGLCCFHSAALALLPVAVLLLSLTEFLLPIRYALTAETASVRHGLTALEIRWADVQHAYLSDEGIKLSPLRTRNSRFEPLRGVFLRFGDGNQEAVIAAVTRLRSGDTHGE